MAHQVASAQESLPARVFVGCVSGVRERRALADGGTSRYSAVVGSVIDVISETRFARNPRLGVRPRGIFTFRYQ